MISFKRAITLGCCPRARTGTKLRAGEEEAEADEGRDEVEKRREGVAVVVAGSRCACGRGRMSPPLGVVRAPGGLLVRVTVLKEQVIAGRAGRWCSSWVRSRAPGVRARKKGIVGECDDVLESPTPLGYGPVGV